MATEKEFEGKDLEEALAEAARAMGIAEPDLHYRILEQGRRGLFGLGAKSVRIRVMPPVEQPEPPAAEVEPLRLDERPRKASRSEETPPPPGSDDVVQALRRMLELTGFELTVEAVSGDGGLHLQLAGPDQKLLTQKDGELISSLQFLLNRMQRRAWPDVGRIQLVCDGRRRGRDGELVALTREVAQQVRRTGRAKRLHPMNAYERRLVHLTVREFGQLGSRSEGNGHLKRVRVFKQN